LSDEYKLLQDKIDKIGAFRFTIKGWSVTAVVAGLIAGSTGKGASQMVVAGILTIFLCWFFWLERDQVKLSWRFSARIMEIEDHIKRARIGLRWSSQFPTPLIGSRAIDPPKRRGAKRKRNSAASRETKLWIASHAHFYVTLIAISWAWAILPVKSTDATPTNVVISSDTIQRAPKAEDKSGSENPAGNGPSSANTNREKRSGANNHAR
jgi:hypothetical protein